MNESTDKEALSQEINSLHERHLTKTAIKCFIWFGIASLITYFYPEKQWVWYIVLIFIIIAISFAIFTKMLAIRVAKQEQSKNSNEDQR